MNEGARKWLLTLVLIGITAYIAAMPQPFPGYLAKVDFQAYWGASYLLAHSQDSSDPALLLQVQQEMVGLEDQEEAQMAWNPPWLLVWMIPLTFLDFDQASWIWFLISMTLVLSSVFMLSHVFATKANEMRLVIMGAIAAFLFVPTLTTLMVGQICSLILFGLSAFLFLDKNQYPFLAGAALSLTTIKPHLVYLTLPLILVELAARRQWRTMAGLGASLIGGAAAAVMLRPTLIPEYFGTVGGGSLLLRTTPTLGYFLSTIFGWQGMKLMGVVVLPASLIVWAKRRQHSDISLQEMLAFTLPFSVVTAPFGWSFDVIILIVPLMQLSAWMVSGRLGRSDSVMIALSFVAANAFMIYRRSVDMQDAQFFWFPIVIACLYLWGVLRSTQRGARLGAADTLKV